MCITLSFSQLICTTQSNRSFFSCIICSSGFRGGAKFCAPPPPNLKNYINHIRATLCQVCLLKGISEAKILQFQIQIDFFFIAFVLKPPLVLVFKGTVHECFKTSHQFRLSRSILNKQVSCIMALHVGCTNCVSVFRCVSDRVWLTHYQKPTETYRLNRQYILQRVPFHKRH